MKKTLILILGLAVGLATATASAQSGSDDFSAGRKITGSAYRPYSARTYSRHAINHGQVLQYYGKNYGTVPTETAKEHAVEVRRNVDAFGTELAKLETEYKSDAEAMKLIAEIRKHQKEALTHCGMLEAECAKHAPQGEKVATCCSDMLTHLRAADAAHDKLLKHLNIPLPGAAPKEEPKK